MRAVLYAALALAAAVIILAAAPTIALCRAAGTHPDGDQT